MKYFKKTMCMLLASATLLTGCSIGGKEIVLDINTIDETSLAVGAFLHDFYLYDWHKKGTFHGIRRLFEMHGFSHPGCACVNAEKVFHITKKEQSIISSHMWPLTFRHVPSCREAIIVCLADKYCAVVESMFKHSRVAAAKNANGEYDEW